MNSLTAMMAHSQRETFSEDPYELKERWKTDPVTSMKADGSPSPVWSAGSSGKKWRLIIFPQGYKENKDKFLSLFLMACQLNEEHSVSVSLKCHGVKQTASSSFSFTFSKVVKNRGLMQFIPLEELADYETEDGCLDLELSISFRPAVSSVGVNYRKTTGFVGLKNQGATCYMNSALECLFHTPAFRRLVFSLPIDEHMDDPKKSTTLNLQRLFCLMQLAPIAPSTQELTTSFGWGAWDVFMQHDVQEFLRVLIDNLDEKMKKTQNAEAISSLLRGRTYNFVKCINYDYTSERKEDFFDLSLVVKGKRNLQESLEEFVEDDVLDGKNQYEVEGHGKEDAIKGCRFQELPPVLHIHLQRFVYDPLYGDMRKVSERWEFPFELDMEPYMSDDSNKAIQQVYELTSVLVHMGDRYGGHYYAFCRPSEKREWFRFNDNEVAAVTESEVIENNFGGTGKYFSAYFLVYVRKSELSKIMAPVTDSEIPGYLKDYYVEWKHAHLGGPPSYNIQFIADGDYVKQFESFGCQYQATNSESIIETPGTIKFSDFMTQLKTAAGFQGQECSLWLVGDKNCPQRRIKPDTQIKERFGHGEQRKVFVSDYTDPEVKGEVPLIIGYYDPSVVSKSLQFVKFVVLPPTANLRSLENDIRARFSLPSDLELSVYSLDSNYSTSELSLDSTLEEQKIKCGWVCFQALNPSTEKKPFGNLTEFRSIDFIENDFCPTLSSFCQAIQASKRITCADLLSPEDPAFGMSIPFDKPITALLKCIRGALKLSDSDSVLLFRQESGIPAEHPIDTNIASSISQVRSHTMYFYIVRGVPQDKMKTLTFFRTTVLDKSLQVIAQPALLMPSKFTVAEVLAKLYEKEVLTRGEPVRVLSHVGSRIVKLMQVWDELSEFSSVSFRVELIPDDQRDADASELVRVMLTHNQVTPRQGAFGVPFMFLLIQDEPWKETRARLAKLANVDAAKVKFGYTNSSSNLKDYKRIDDDDLVLADVLDGNLSVVYIFVEGRSNNPNTWTFNRGIKIYN